MIILGEEAREKMLEGINLVADAVKPTLGPMARTVVLKEYGKPIIVNDGVTVAKSIYHDDEFVDMGAKLLIEVATQAQNMAGDGTTTACVLAQSFCQEGMKLIKEGKNPVDVANFLKKLADEISTGLIDEAKPIQNSDEIKNVATIAANNDEHIGDLISQAIEKVGKNGVITVTESKDMRTHIDVVQGMEIDRGYRSHHLAIDKEKNKTEMLNPYILVSNFSIVRFQELVPLLEKVSETKRPLLVISRALEQHALTNLIVNVMGGVVQCCAIESPDYGYVSDHLLEDISILTGAKFLDTQTNVKLEEVQIKDLGQAEKVTVGETKTLIIGGHGSENDIQDRVTMLESHMPDALNDFVRDKMKTRAAKLLGGVGVLHVGAASELEMRDKKERVDDALNATRAAMEMGIIAGGGFALAQYQNSEYFGKCLTVPYFQILDNAGIKKSNSIIPINAKTGEEISDMIVEGIVDPVKVTISSLNSAASVAALVLTSEVLVGEKDEMPPM
jgi:chaperonin GroEL